MIQFSDVKLEIFIPGIILIGTDEDDILKGTEGGDTMQVTVMILLKEETEMTRYLVEVELTS